MTKENTLAVNSLPSPTWNRLHMNETTVTLPPLDGPCKADWSGAEVTAAPPQWFPPVWAKKRKRPLLPWRRTGSPPKRIPIPPPG